MTRDYNQRFRQDVTGASYLRPTEPKFDFNNTTQPLPWLNRPAPTEPLRARRFYPCLDTPLLEYLAKRNVSTEFLAEIDDFFLRNPEITSHELGRQLVWTMNESPPLYAYRYFIRGYKRPARYIEGFFQENFHIPDDFQMLPLEHRYDPELVEFFDGFEIRMDIIHRIQEEVEFACDLISLGRTVKPGLRRLVWYAIWGNPVDAYKWYEYYYQEDYQPHRRLPEHSILSEIPKTTSGTLYHTVMMPARRHKHVRRLMACANDAGMDVLQVLKKEYRMALKRRGHTRKEIRFFCKIAYRRLDEERRFPTGVDIVNLMLDDVEFRRTDTIRSWPEVFKIANERGKYERSYVYSLSRYLRATNRTGKTQARDFRRMYKKEKSTWDREIRINYAAYTHWN